VEVSLARVDCTEIGDFDSLHDAFDNVFQFPDFYGRNMDAWIDCMSHLDDPEAQMTGIHVGKGRVLGLELVNSAKLRKKAPEVYAAIIECSSFVNWRRIECDEHPILALAMDS